MSACRTRRAALVVRHGDPAQVVPALAAQVGATQVHVSADAGVYGRRRDAAVAAALADDGRRLVATGTPYAIGPGTLRSGAGTPFKVFSPFHRAWLAHGFPGPAPSESAARAGTWAGGIATGPMPAEPGRAEVGDLELPEAGEPAARERWRAFVEGPLAGYDEGRDRPGVQGTSAMSAHLKYGEIHPRTLLADLAAHQGEAADRYRSELCWRDFYADVLWHHPESARESLRADLAGMKVDPPGERFVAWQQGRTGFPVVDAGMRQLLAEGWVHNRARMIVASFLVKDLHVDVAATGPGTSCTGCGTATSPATTTAGSGWPAPAPTRRPSSASSTRSRRA